MHIGHRHGGRDDHDLRIVDIGKATATDAHGVGKWAGMQQILSFTPGTGGIAIEQLEFTRQSLDQYAEGDGGPHSPHPHNRDFRKCRGHEHHLLQHRAGIFCLVFIT